MKIKCTQFSLSNENIAKLQAGRDYEEVLMPIDTKHPEMSAEQVDSVLLKLFEGPDSNNMTREFGPFAMLKLFVATPKNWPGDFQNKQRNAGIVFRTKGLEKLMNAEGQRLEISKAGIDNPFGPSVRTFFHKDRLPGGEPAGTYCTSQQ